MPWYLRLYELKLYICVCVCVCVCVPHRYGVLAAFLFFLTLFLSSAVETLAWRTEREEQRAKRRVQDAERDGDATTEPLLDGDAQVSTRLRLCHQSQPAMRQKTHWRMAAGVCTLLCILVTSSWRCVVRYASYQAGQTGDASAQVSQLPGAKTEPAKATGFFGLSHK